MTEASEFGIDACYRDAWGEPRTAPEATVARLLEALKRGMPEGTVAAADEPGDDDRRCFQPDWDRTGRLWGIAVQLYSIHSPRNWGIGDFTDLRHLITYAADAGAQFVGVSPLHALFAADSSRFSPYSPSSREFLNVLFIDPAAMRAYTIAPAARAAAEELLFQSRVGALRDAELVDYVGVATCKQTIFRLVFDAFDALVAHQPDHPMAVDFARFLRERGEPLRRFTIYEALSCQHGFGPNWTSWRADYRDPTSASVDEFAASNRREVRYHAFLQWEAEAQLAACATAARVAGMEIGLYLDVAVGTDPGSAEAWSERRDMIRGFHIGAPPDAWNEAGQDWGLAAFDPRALARNGCDFYRRILVAVMRHAGAVRIDHVLGFHRLFLIAAGGAPRDGVYLRMPAHLLCRTLAEESVRARCLVIGEDLGTVPADFHGLLGRYGILSYRLLIFAKNGSRFLAPDEYPRESLVAVATHDLPPLLGFWSGNDIALRASLDLFPDEAKWRSALDERAADCQAIETAFAAAGEDAADIMVAAYGFLARTPCRLLLVPMEDLAMERAQPNLPGSDDRHPNWRRKLGRALAAIFASTHAAAVLAMIRAARPNGIGR
jgi:(1->4)-alpha-D-glucan 1-alpha-D-glucosylmutase